MLIHLMCRSKANGRQERSDLQFNVDHVLLKLQLYTQSTVASGPFPKLVYEYFGPYKVLAR